VVRQLVRALRRDHLRPVSLVEYRRQAFTGRTDGRVRVTFDGELRTARGNDLFQSSISWRRCFDPHVVVMEIKVDESLPYWLQKIIHKYQLQVTAVSKYCLGVAANALR
jgi:SPX domain protein involved in polyphosphate accumulation